MFMMYLEQIGLFAVWVLLPLIPAILIYWLFPETKVAVDGPLADLRVNAGGAFAAYLIVFLVMSAFIKENFDKIVHPTWTIQGKVKLIGKDGQERHSVNYFQNAVVKTIPPVVTVSVGDPFFSVNVPDISGDAPLLVLDIPDFGVYMREIAPGEIDWHKRKIALKDVIEIREQTHNSSSDKPLTTAP